MKVLEGFNDLLTVRPDLAKEYSSKNEKSASETVYSNTKIVLWECEFGHEWKASLSDRDRGRKKCIICSRRSVIPGVNDLFTTHPELESIWSETNTVDPQTVHFGSGHKVMWNCSEGHEDYLAIIYNRSRDKGCPKCAPEKAFKSRRRTDLAKKPSLAKARPDLLLEWDFEKNLINPDEITAGSKSLVWWKCVVDSNEWRSTIDNRNRGRNCPKCSDRFSQLEKEVLDIIDTYLTDRGLSTTVLHNTRPLSSEGKKLELDIYLPELRVAFEVQDFATHDRDVDGVVAKFKGLGLIKKGPIYHESKTALAKLKLGVDLFELWEDEIRDGSCTARVNSILSSAIDSYSIFEISA